MTAPHPVVVDLFLELLFGRAVEEIPFQIVLAHMVLAEPQVVVEVVGRFRRAVLALLGAARVLADPGRGLERARHAALAARLLLLRGRHAHVETEGIRVAHLACLFDSVARV